MFRLTCTQRPERRVVIEGNLVGLYVEELRAVAAPFLACGEPWSVELSGIGFANAHGVALLAVLDAAGVELTGASAFLMELLKHERTRAESRAAERASDDERALTIALRSSEPAARELAQEQIVRRFGPELLATAERILVSREEACLALRDAFVAAFEALEHLPEPARLGPWLRRFVAQEALRRRAPTPAPSEAEPADHLPRFTPSGLRILDDADESLGMEGPGAHLESLPPALAARVRAAVDQLADSQRIPFLLCDVEGFGIPEAASLLGLSQPEVKRRLHHARQALRFLLGRALASSGHLVRA